MRVAIYARVSTKDKGQSTDNQLPDLRRFAAAHQYEVVQEYVEEESAGTGKRSQFQQLFADAHKRQFDFVLFWSLDRFSREGALATMTYLNQLESWGVGYKSYTEQYLDSTGLFKDAIVSILATIAKQEKVRLSERVKAGLVRTVAKGTKLGAPVIDDEVVAQAQRFRASGMSNQKIAKALQISPSTVAKYLVKEEGPAE